MWRRRRRRGGGGLLEFMICRDFMTNVAAVNRCLFRCIVTTFMLWRGTLGKRRKSSDDYTEMMRGEMTSHSGAVQQSSRGCTAYYSLSKVSIWGCERLTRNIDSTEILRGEMGPLTRIPTWELSHVKVILQLSIMAIGCSFHLNKAF